MSYGFLKFLQICVIVIYISYCFFIEGEPYVQQRAFEPFISVTDLGSISKAAEVIYRSSAAVTRQIFGTRALTYTILKNVQREQAYKSRALCLAGGI